MKNQLFSIRNYNNDLALLLLRITVGGLLLINHGIGKIEKLQNPPVKFMDFMGIGPEASLCLVIFAEAVCSMLVVLGLVTRLACIPVIITFLVAILDAHAGSPLSKIELPLIYLLSYIILLITGPGKYSIDRGISHS